MCPKPSNPDRKNTTLAVRKETKIRLDRFRNKSIHRQGNENDDELLVRIMTALELAKPDLVHEPRPTYPKM